MKPLKTVAQVESVSKPGLYSVTDAKGLYLQVGPTGGKSWCFRYRAATGKRRLMGLGSTDRVTLADARKTAIAATALQNTGVDPIDAARAKRANVNAPPPGPKVHTFRSVTDEYIALKSQEWKSLQSSRTLPKQFGKWIHPTLGNLPVGAITADDVKQALTGVSRAAPETARRLRGHTAEILAMAAARGYRDKNTANPADRKLLKYLLPMKRPPVVHFPAATLETAPVIFRRIHAAEGTVFRAIEFAVLTTVRPGTALRATWNEVDLSKALWTIPAARMKTGIEFHVPLTPAAMEVLERVAAIRCCEYLFPGASANRPLSYSLFQTALDKKLGIKGVTLHGFRSTFRDAAADILNAPRDLCELQLSHALGATEASYRRLTALNQRRALLEKYAAWLMGEFGAVVPFPVAVSG
jgi:integrase